MMRVHEAPEDALNAYCSQRMVRTARVRDHVMGSKTPEQWYDDLEWLYGGNGLEAG